MADQHLFLGPNRQWKCWKAIWNSVDIRIGVKERFHILFASSRCLQNREESERLKRQLFITPLFVKWSFQQIFINKRLVMRLYCSKLSAVLHVRMTFKRRWEKKRLIGSFWIRQPKKGKAVPSMCPGPVRAVGTHRHCTTRIYLASHRDQHRQAPQHAQQPRAAHLPGTPGGRSVNRMCLCTGEIPAAAVQPRHLVCTEAVRGSQWLQLLAQRHRSLG